MFRGSTGHVQISSAYTTGHPYLRALPLRDRAAVADNGDHRAAASRREIQRREQLMRELRRGKSGFHGRFRGRIGIRTIITH
jgi:hypothetical protein